MFIYLSLLVAILGGIIYVLAVNPKYAELGRLMFACGLLAFLLVPPGPIVTMLTGK